MNSPCMSWAVPLLAIGLVALKVGAADEPAGVSLSIPAETVADYVHAVIEADRTFYTVHVVERLQARGSIVASQNWRQAGTLPLPVQFLSESSNLAATTGSTVRYRLLSLWPINPENGPVTAFEQTGLQAVLKNPDRPYTGIVTEGGARYFEALYADRAVTQSCIGCHN